MPSLKKMKILVSLLSLFLFSGCTLLPYKNLAQYNVVLNCKKVNIIDKQTNKTKTLLQKSNFGFNANDGRMVYEINQDGEYQYAKYHSERSGKIIYNSLSENIMLVIGSSKRGTFIAMDYSNVTYIFFDCTKK